MATTTTNFSFIKPGVADPVDADLWGGQLNTNSDNLDGFLKTARDFLSVSTTDVTFTVTTAERNKLILADTSSNAITVNLPAAATAGDGFEIAVKITDATNSVTIDGNAAETIDGAATLVLSTLNDAVLLVCDGSNWFVKADQIPASDATETVKGIVELATKAELETETATGGTGASLVATPATMKQHPGVVKGWVSIDGTGTIAIRDSYNVSSLVDNAIGEYTINWDVDFSNTNYSVVAMCELASNTGAIITNTLFNTAPGVGSVRIIHNNVANTNVDVNFSFVQALGDQ